MKKTFLIAICVVFCATLSFSVTGVNAAEYNVKGLKPFTSQTAYLSLIGYIQYLSKHQEGKELSRTEAIKILNASEKAFVADEKAEGKPAKKAKKVRKVKKAKEEKAAEPKAEEPKVEEPKAEKKAEEPKAEPKAEKKAEEPKAEKKAEEKK